MKSMVQAFLVLLLVIEPIVSYAQTQQAPPNVSEVSSPSTSQTPQTTESAPAQPAAAASLPSTPQTQQAPDSSPPAPAPPTANATKAKRKRGHLSGFDIGIIVASAFLLYIVLNMDGD